MRAAAVGAAVWRWMEDEDHGAIFVSIAASHTAEDRLEDLHGQLLDARASVMRSDCEVWRRFRRRFGIADLAWKIEANSGLNGPHPGLHLVLLTTRHWDATDAQRAEAWLILAFRAALKAVGYRGELGIGNGVDVRPVDDPAGVGRYLTKWGIGAELAGEAGKAGRVSTSVPYQAIPAVLADELGRANPYGRRYQTDREVRRLVDGWGDFVRLAVTDKRHWYRGFRSLKTLVPELRDAKDDRARIAVCTDVLPVELRPGVHDDAEEGEDDSEGEGGETLVVDQRAWADAVETWSQPRFLPHVWAVRRCRWTDGRYGPGVPLELAIVWVIEDEGLDAAAAALCGLSGGALVVDGGALRVEPMRHARTMVPQLVAATLDS